jgi:hypothetical protein
MATTNKITINQREFREIIGNAAAKIALVPAKKLAAQIVEFKKKEFLDEFDSHDVSTEIKAGAEPNFGIGDANGNLFSFLGFNAGSDPVGDLRSYLNKSIKLGPSYAYNKGTRTYTFKIQFPTIDEIKEVTNLGNYTDDGWGENRSWAISIERGIPGLNRYKYSLNEKELGGNSRSGTGLQRKNILRNSQYKPRKYISELLKILYSV